MNAKETTEKTGEAVRSSEWLERMAEKAYQVGIDAARAVEGCGYDRTWEDTNPASKSGYIAMVKWIDEQVRSNAAMSDGAKTL